MPLDHRHTIAAAELTYANLGGVSLAALAFIGPVFGSNGLRTTISLIPLVAGLFLLPLRRALEESSLWQLSRTGLDRSLPQDYGFRFYVSASFAAASTTGFSLLAFAFGAEFLPQHFHHMLLVSTSAALLVGLTYRYVARLPQDLTLVSAYGMATATAVLLHMVQRPSHPGFWPVLFLQSAFASVSYRVEDFFSANRCPAFIRGRTLGSIRLIGLGVYAAVLVWARWTHLQTFLASLIAAWGLGLAAALAWLLLRRRLSLKVPS
jgi:hypothetical protein